MRAMRAEQFSGYEGLELVASKTSDGIGGEVLSEALGTLALDGSLTTLGYSASRKATIDVAKTFPLAEAADALRYPVESRPFGRVVLTV